MIKRAIKAIPSSNKIIVHRSRDGACGGEGGGAENWCNDSPPLVYLYVHSESDSYVPKMYDMTGTAGQSNFHTRIFPFPVKLH